MKEEGDRMNDEITVFGTGGKVDRRYVSINAVYEVLNRERVGNVKVWDGIDAIADSVTLTMPSKDFKPHVVTEE